MNFDFELNGPLIEAIGWTLIHSLWIGSFCAATAGLALALLRNSNSRIRYFVSCASLILLIALLILTFAIEWNVAPWQLSSEPSLLALSKMAHSVFTNAPSDSSRSEFQFVPALESLLPQVVLIWMTGVCLFSIRNIRALNSVRKLRCTAEPVSDIGIESRVLEFAARLAITRPVQLLKSAALEVPIAVGWLRPMVILPLSTLSGLSPKELDAILIHELAHISRHDYLVNLLQVSAETILFYHPAVLWLSNRIRDEREDCCDDVVIALQGDRVTYANALANLEEYRAFSPQLVVPATAGDLLRRIRRIATGATRRFGPSAYSQPS
jgi:beta-lactamase regulating signal transducer with metallopeptidase domain